MGVCVTVGDGVNVDVGVGETVGVGVVVSTNGNAPIKSDSEMPPMTFPLPELPPSASATAGLLPVNSAANA